MKIKAKKSDLVWNYIGAIVSLTSNFVVLPVLMFYLSGDQLGLWYVFLSLGGLVHLFDFGFNPTLARNIAYCWSGAETLVKENVIFVNRDNSKPNIVLLKKVMVTCKTIYLLISGAALLILLTFGTNHVNNISSRLIGNNHIVSWYIFCVAVFLNLYFGYYSAFLRGVGAIKELNVAMVISKLSQIIITVIFLIMGFELLAVASAYLIFSIIFRIISKKKFNDYENIGTSLKEISGEFDFKVIKKMFEIIWHNAWKDGLVSLSTYVSNQATVLICSSYFSLATTGVYSISIQIVAAITQISGMLYTTYQPSLQSAHINRNIKESKKMMSRAMVVYVALFWTGIVGLIFVGIPLIKLVKPDIIINIPILLGIAIYKFLLMHHSYYASYISNSNSIPYMRSFLVSSFVSVFIALILIRYTTLQLWGLIIAQIVTQAVYNNWKWPYAVMKSLDLNPILMVRIGFQDIAKKIFVKISSN